MILSVFLYTLYPPGKSKDVSALREDFESEKSGLFDSDGEDGDVEDEGHLDADENSKPSDKMEQIV